MGVCIRERLGLSGDFRLEQGLIKGSVSTGKEATMGFDFFTWIREGVRQSVLMGVADACESLGSPQNGERMDQRITAYLQDGEVQAPVRRIAGSGTATRRKLGRGLTQVETDTTGAS